MPDRRRHPAGQPAPRLHASGRWECRVELPPVNGKRDRRSVYGATPEAALAAAAKLRQRSGGEWDASRQTVAEYLTRWWEDVHAPRIQPATVVSQRAALQLHILPTLGHHRLAQLTPAHVQAALAQWQRAGYKPGTIRRWHQVLRQALDTAVKWEVISRNPAAFVDLPRLNREKPRVLDEAMARRFLVALSDHPWEALFLVALFTGIRGGELVALRWAAIDFEQYRLRVERGLVYADGILHEGPPKTPAGYRDIKLLPEVVAALRRHRQRERERQVQTIDFERPDLVFTGLRGQPLRTQWINERLLPRVLKQAGLPRVRLHALRHSAASLMLKRGADIAAVSVILGHSSPAITMQIYRAVLPGETEEAVERLHGLLSDAPETVPGDTADEHTL